MVKFKFLYQRGSTQVFEFGRVYGLFTVCADGRVRWLETPATSEAEAIALAEHFESGRA